MNFKNVFVISVPQCEGNISPCHENISSRNANISPLDNKYLPLQGTYFTMIWKYLMSRAQQSVNLSKLTQLKTNQTNQTFRLTSASIV